MISVSQGDEVRGLGHFSEPGNGRAGQELNACASFSNTQPLGCSRFLFWPCPPAERREARCLWGRCQYSLRCEAEQIGTTMPALGAIWVIHSVPSSKNFVVLLLTILCQFLWSLNRIPCSSRQTNGPAMIQFIRGRNIIYHHYNNYYYYYVEDKEEVEGYLVAFFYNSKKILFIFCNLV